MLHNITKQNCLGFSSGLIIGAVSAFFVVGAVVISSLEVRVPPVFPPTPSLSTNPPQPPTSKLPRFASCDQLKKKVQEYTQQPARGGGGPVILEQQSKITTDSVNSPSAGGGGGPDFSTTNVQVEGVDEADVIKTDGNYIYSITKEKVYITQTSPSFEKVSEISFAQGESPNELFIDDKKLIIIGSKSGYVRSETNTSDSIDPGLPGIPSPNYYYRQFVYIYTMFDATTPTKVRSLEFDSSYINSRLVDGILYLALNKSVYFPQQSILQYPENIKIPTVEETLPQMSDSSINMPFSAYAQCTDISYIEPITTSSYLTLAAIPLRQNTSVKTQVIIGAGSTIYASQKNLYAAIVDYGTIVDKFIGRVTDRPSEKTTIHKFELNNGAIAYMAAGSVDGHILNQFSMDEYDGYFRIATTVGEVSRNLESQSDNRLYILDTNMNIVGKLENIARGEKIYSARFIGRRGYLVTFKKVDPFFTLDLTNPRAPKIAGELKIPGFSDYLHPYDETHIIGFGKDTIEAEGGNFAWYQGLKIALFDVSDFNAPKELHRIILGDRGSDSPVLYDHKALLFEKSKNLLVLPATIATITESDRQRGSWQSPAYGRTTFSGALVYDVTLDSGFQEKVRIVHSNMPDMPLDKYYYNNNPITRSLYIGQNLYTFSSSKIQQHNMNDWSMTKEIQF